MGRPQASRQARLRVELQVDGGYAPVATANVLAAWQAYRRKAVSREDFRVLIAAHALVCSRNQVGPEDPVLFRVSELSGLTGGIPLGRLRSSVRRLDELGLMFWTDRGPVFGTAQTGHDSPGRFESGQERVGAAESHENSPEDRSGPPRGLGRLPRVPVWAPRRGAETFPASRNPTIGSELAARGRDEAERLTTKPFLPVPRRLLRAIARGQLTSAQSAVALSAVARCLWLDRGAITNAVGTVPATLVTEVFELDESSVKRARKGLERLGFMHRIEMPHWHRQRYGARFELNLSWRGLDLQPVKPEPPVDNLGPTRNGLPPRKRAFPNEMPPPRTNQDPSSKLVNHQKPAGGETTGVHTHNEANSNPKTTKPTLRAVSVADLEDPLRTLHLHAELVQQGVVRDSEADRLRVFACAARALRKARNPGGMFLALVRRAELREHITGLDEEQGRGRYRQHIHEQTRRRFELLRGGIGSLTSDAKDASSNPTHTANESHSKPMSTPKSSDLSPFSAVLREVVGEPTRCDRTPTKRSQELSRDARFVLEVWRICEQTNEPLEPLMLMRRSPKLQDWNEERYRKAEQELRSQGLQWDPLSRSVWRVPVRSVSTARCETDF